MEFKGQATQKQLDYIAVLRSKKDITGMPINVNELWSEYISKFQASCLIKDLERCPDAKPEKYIPQPKSNFKKGMTVISKAYGEGTVIDVKKEQIKVNFNGVEKKMFESYLTIKED